jgi:hypothetical protein
MRLLIGEGKREKLGKSTWRPDELFPSIDSLILAPLHSSVSLG